MYLIKTVARLKKSYHLQVGPIKESLPYFDQAEKSLYNSCYVGPEPPTYFLSVKSCVLKNRMGSVADLVLIQVKCTKILYYACKLASCILFKVEDCCD